MVKQYNLLHITARRTRLAPQKPTHMGKLAHFIHIDLMQRFKVFKYYLDAIFTQ